MYYYAVFDLISIQQHNTFSKDKLAFQSCWLLFNYYTKHFLNQTLAMCINILGMGYSCCVIMDQIFGINNISF